MATTSKYNTISLVKVLELGLESRVKKTITEHFVQQQLKSFEEELRSKIKPLVDSIILDDIKHVRDLLNLHDDLFIHLQWGEEELLDKKL